MPVHTIYPIRLLTSDTNNFTWKLLFSPCHIHNCVRYSSAQGGFSRLHRTLSQKTCSLEKHEPSSCKTCPMLAPEEKVLLSQSRNQHATISGTVLHEGCKKLWPAALTMTYKHRHIPTHMRTVRAHSVTQGLTRCRRKTSPHKSIHSWALGQLQAAIRSHGLHNEAHVVSLDLITATHAGNRGGTGLPLEDSGWPSQSSKNKSTNLQHLCDPTT